MSIFPEANATARALAPRPIPAPDANCAGFCSTWRAKWWVVTDQNSPRVAETV
ncbi:hypothetical protein [Mycobacterium sp.]|uniref:hypothetical protein n=1 Tax=Mycobacterium sp. TaxID=1785 RepID=UPI003D6BFD69